jgi:hypothetical protein
MKDGALRRDRLFTLDWDRCDSLSKARKLAKAEVAELLQFSNNIIYFDSGSENPYFMIEGPA